MSVHVPSYVFGVLSGLEKGGFQAFLVGGCVRDLLRGSQPSDWDICTSALPRSVAELFPRTVLTGAKHGTVTVLADGGMTEVTTFRREAGYSDHRRPDSVEFVSDLDTDLGRRDFTMNAMAMDMRGRLFDPFGGRADVAAGLIRCVGEPEKRFGEDSLRMLRALRFKATLGFAIDAETAAAMEKLAPSCVRPSAERVRDELLKILLSGAPETASEALRLGLLSPHAAAGDCDLSALRGVSGTKELRLAALCLALARAGHISSPNRLLSSLRFDNSTVARVSAACAIAARGFPRDSGGMKRVLRDFGRDAASMAAELDGRDSLAALKRVLSSGECWSLRSLALSGQELAENGLSGPELGNALAALLEHVIDSPEDNQRNILLKLAEKRGYFTLT